MIAVAQETQALAGVAITAVVSLFIGLFQLRTGAKKSVADTLLKDNERLHGRITELEEDLKEAKDTERGLTQKVSDQQGEINRLKGQVETLMQGEKFWKDRYHELKEERT